MKSSAAQKVARVSPTRATWTPSRIVALIVIGPVAAIAMGSLIEIANPTYMQDARDGAVQVVTSTLKPYTGVNR
jgi:hypothetical protein